jgi:hypothetical protein
MKNASPHIEGVVNSRRSKGRALPVSAFFILAVIVSAAFFTEPAAAKRMDSSRIARIAFNPLNQPASFAAGIPNAATQPLRIQTQNALGVGENVTGDGESVLITVTTSSTTGRFSNSPSGPFTNSAIIVSVTSGRQNSQDIFYLETTPGAVVLTASVLFPGNTVLFGAETSVTKIVSGGGDRLAFSTQPGNASVDNIINPPVNVRIQDAAGNLDTQSSRNITLSLGADPSGAALSGTTTVAAVNGIATFTNLRLNKAGSGYTLIATSNLPAPALASAQSNPFNVNKLSQTIEFEELEDRTYGDDDFEIYASATSGLTVSFQSLTPETCSVTANTVAIEAAGDCTIRASQAGDPNHLYADDVDRSFTINKADASILVSPYEVVFDGQPHTATLVSISGVKGETDSQVGTVDLSQTVHTNAGAYSNDPWTFAGNANYNDASGTVDNSISKAPAAATAGSGSAVYDGAEKPVDSCSISGPGYLGDLTCSNDRPSVGPNAGTYFIAPVVSATGLSNFDIAKINGAFTIEKAPTFVSVTFEPGPYVYRGSSFNATARAGGPGGLDQDLPVSYSGDCLNVTSLNGCSASAAYPESANHHRSIGGSSITISKKALDVTASSHTLTFGSPVPVVTPALSGFVPGETILAIDVVPECSTTYAVGSSIGSYPTSCVGGHDNNYSFTQPYAEGFVEVNTACGSFNGFLSPIGGANAFPNIAGPGGSFSSPLRTFKLNSTIPFKFTAVCYGGPLTTGIQTLVAQKFSNGVPVGDEVIILANDDSTPDNLFRFAEGQWHFNFKTKELGDIAQGVWLFEARLFDGSRYGVWLAIRK